MRKACCIIYVFLHFSVLQAQVQLNGIVYRDSISKKPADSALIYLSSGKGIYANNYGAYKISVQAADTLWVYYQNKILSFYLSSSQLTREHFDIYLDDSVHGKLQFNQLKPVFVKNNSYKDDSIKNREEYGYIFNYRKSKLSMGNNKWHDSISVPGARVAIDTKNKKLSLLNITSVAHAVRYRAGSQKLRLQKRLVEIEQSNYVSRVFTPALVEKYTAIHDDDSLHCFIRKYPPAFSELINMNELDLAMYIVKKAKAFRESK